MRRLFDQPGRAAARALLAALPVLAACGDGATSTGEPAAPPHVAAVAALHCTATVADRSVTCQPAAAPAGTRFRGDLRVLGGQGTNVRLTTSALSYTAATEVLTFNVTVQNLMTLPLATANGTARDDRGVQVFLAQPPVVTQGTGAVSLLNATGTAAFTAAEQPYFQYGGKVGGADQPELGADGILSSGEVSAARQWRMSMPASVAAFDFDLFVAAEMPAGPVTTAAPQVTAVSPDTLVPGGVAVVTGINFADDPLQNTVTINGAAAQVIGPGDQEHQLRVRVPCGPGGDASVQVTRGGMAGVPVSHPQKGGATQTLAPGEFAVVSDPAQVACTVLAPGNGPATYVMAVVNANTSPNTRFTFSVAGSTPGGAPASVMAVPGAGPANAAEAARPADPRGRVTEVNRAQYARLRRQTAPAGVARTAGATRAALVTPPASRTFRVPSISSSTPCTTYTTVTANRVYLSGKIAIYEDVSVPSDAKAAANAQMAGYYVKVGDQYNAEIEPLLRQNFGDPLVRDTDNDGVLTLLVTPKARQPLVHSAFSSACDLYPNAPGNTSSNYGEIVYTSAPDGASPISEYFVTPTVWYRDVREQLIRAAYHLTSAQAHTANGSPSLEEYWLDEALAYIAVEIWARTYLYIVPWKGNGIWVRDHSAPGPWCDWGLNSPAVCAANPRAPVRATTGHFLGVNSTMQSMGYYSPFFNLSDYGPTAWMLVRYAVDRYAGSESVFLTALTQSSTTGIANLTARAGVPADQLLARWHLALYADDSPLLASPAADLRFPAWNLPDINLGVSADARSWLGYDIPSVPLQPIALTFGNFRQVAMAFGSPINVNGGGVVYFKLSGTQNGPQTFGVYSQDGGPASPDVRLAIVRMQ